MAGTWSAGSNVGYTTYNPYAGGNEDSAFCAGGGATPVSTCREWNGTAWSAGGSLTATRTRCSLGDCGNAENAIASGGWQTSLTSTTFTYNGTSWSNVNALNAGRWGHGCAGNGASSIAVAGSNNGVDNLIKTCENWNGTSWSSITDYYANARSIVTGGNPSAAITMSAYSGGTYVNTSYSWNGSSWSALSSISTARYEAAGGGSTAKAMICGGRDSAITASTEEYNGSAWSAGGNLNTARRLVGGGLSGSGISVSGYTTAAVQTVEIYEYPSEPTEIIRIGSSNRVSSSSRIPKLELKLAQSTPTVLTTPTYDGSGQCVHPSVRYLIDFGPYDYYMAMTPYPGMNDAYENPSLLGSSDGLAWEVPSGITNPLAPMPSGGHNCDPCLTYAAGTLYCYYCKWVSPVDKLQRITITDDPLTVGTNAECTLDGYTTYIWAPYVLYNGSGDWVLWFVDSNHNLSRYISTDGLTWTNRTIISITTNGIRTQNIITPWHFSVKKMDDGRYLFICCCYPVGGNSTSTDLYYAVAKDFDAHLDFQSTPLITEFTGWGNRQVYHSDLCQMENGTWRLYISAATTGNVWRVGYADISLS